MLRQAREFINLHAYYSREETLDFIQNLNRDGLTQLHLRKYPYPELKLNFLEALSSSLCLLKLHLDLNLNVEGNGNFLHDLAWYSKKYNSTLQEIEYTDNSNNKWDFSALIAIFKACTNLSVITIHHTRWLDWQKLGDFIKEGSTIKTLRLTSGVIDGKSHRLADAILRASLLTLELDGFLIEDASLIWAAATQEMTNHLSLKSRMSDTVFAHIINILLENRTLQTVDFGEVSQKRAALIEKVKAVNFHIEVKYTIKPTDNLQDQMSPISTSKVTTFNHTKKKYSSSLEEELSERRRFKLT